MIEAHPETVSSERTRTHIKGLDEILGGGLPAARTALVVGGPGCGKTVMAFEFIARGAMHDEPGLFVSFEQSSSTLEHDLGSFTWDLRRLLDDGVVKLHHVDLSEAPAATTGNFGLEGLFLQLEGAIEDVGARRIALDTLEVLLDALGDDRSVRNELLRLFKWLEGQGITSLVTSEANAESRAVHQLGEYVADCVITLDQRIEDAIATRRARVVKCRGGAHSGDEHPFMISADGFRLIPVTASSLEHEVTEDYVSTGLPGLDEMLEGVGYYAASSVLVSGTPGAGKSSIAAAFVDAACARGEKALYMAFEESPSQICRNMSSVGIELGRWIEQGLLHIHSRRPSERGLEEHLVVLQALVDDLGPRAIVLDPLTSLGHQGQHPTTRSMMLRLVDYLKGRGITALYTSLLPSNPDQASGDPGLVSSLMDTWVVLRARYSRGMRRRYAFVRKSRGMGHSIQLRELVVRDGVLELAEIEGTEVPDGWAE